MEKGRMRKVIAVVGLTLSLAACVQQGQPGSAPPGEIGMNKTTGGGLIGAGLGGLAGSQLGHGSGKLATTGIGVLLGALVGSQVGQSLDKADLDYAHRTTQSALETGRSGQPIAWTNPDSGNAGTIVPRPAYQSGNTYCREFQQTITVGGQSQEGYGTACRQPDGSWKIIQ
jgi:surface antigen